MTAAPVRCGACGHAATPARRCTCGHIAELHDLSGKGARTNCSITERGKPCGCRRFEPKEASTDA